MDGLDSEWIPLVWVLVGVALVIVEVMLTGFVAVFFGIGALVTGIALWIGMPGDGPAPWLLFSVVSAGLLAALRRRFAEWFRGGVVGEPGARGADDDFLGREARVLRGFGADDHGRGEIDFRGAAWQARAEQLPAGTALAEGEFVTITGRDGMILLVARQEDHR